MTISIIIPAFNEQHTLPRTLSKIRQRAGSDAIQEVIVVDGDSEDATVQVAEENGARVVRSDITSRSVQMNLGAQNARGEILYFLHADSIPPDDFDRQIIRHMQKKDARAGCFRLCFDHDHFLLRLYGWCTRFDIDLFRFGDQSLFIKKELFRSLGGFDGSLKIMEDQDMVKRIKKKGRFLILPEHVETSSRRYLEKGIVKLQLSFTLIIILYYLGASQETLGQVYEKIIE